MMFYNIIDEQGRYIGFKVDPKGDGQLNSHEYSYIYCRKLHQELGDIMGLELKLQEEPGMWEGA